MRTSVRAICVLLVLLASLCSPLTSTDLKDERAEFSEESGPNFDHIPYDVSLIAEGLEGISDGEHSLIIEHSGKPPSDTQYPHNVSFYSNDSERLVLDFIMWPFVHGMSKSHGYYERGAYERAFFSVNLETGNVTQIARTGMQNQAGLWVDPYSDLYVISGEFFFDQHHEGEELSFGTQLYNSTGELLVDWPPTSDDDRLYHGIATDDVLVRASSNFSNGSHYLEVWNYQTNDTWTLPLDNPHWEPLQLDETGLLSIVDGSRLLQLDMNQFSEHPAILMY